MRSGWLRLALGLLLLGGGSALLVSRYLGVPDVPLPTLGGVVEGGSLQHAGRERRFLLYDPGARKRPAPVVLVLHGSMGDAQQARSMMSYEFDRLADEFGFLVAYPEGFEAHWNDCRAAGPYAANELDVDDVGFLRALVDQLVERQGVDRQRVYATGVSNGGQMALRLALEAPDLVRAVAPVLANLPTQDNFDCQHSGRAESLLLMNGSEDPMNPDTGGRVALYGVWGDRGSVLSTLDTVAYWRDLAGHTGDPERERLPERNSSDDSHVEVTRWRKPGLADVVLYHIIGGGHTVPHPLTRMPRLLGATNADIYAAREIWAFFRANGA